MGANFTISQPSFAAGEISPSLRARTDLAKYRVAAALMSDCFALPTGGAASRQGTKAVLRAFVSPQVANSIVRLVKFVFGVTQAYMLELSYDGSDGYLRVIMNGGYVLETAQSITSVTLSASNQVTINKVAHGYSVGDWIWFSSVLGMTELKSSPGFVGVIDSTTFGADSFKINTIDGAEVDGSTWGAFTSGNMARVYRTDLPPDMEDNIASLKFSQNADVMTITNVTQVGGNPYTLTRTAHTVWTFTAITYAATVLKPTSASATRNAAGTLVYSYVVTSVYDLTGEESVPTARFTNAAAASAALNQDTGVNMQIAWTAPASGPVPDRYNIYKGRPVSTTGAMTLPTIFGYIGQATDVDFVDTNIEPDFTRGPPKHDNPFSTYGDPITSTYFGGRQWFGGTLDSPNVMIGSQIGNYHNMDYHLPIRADDSITIGLLSNQVNPIKHLLSLNSLIALTGDGAWSITGGSADEAITALSVRARPQIYDGCSDVVPINASSDILYLSPASTKMRTLAYDFTTNLFTGVDITLLASHLFNSLPIVSMAYSEEPYSLVYAVRDDGKMNTMTYLKEQDVYAWTHYETPGNGGTGVGTDEYVDVATVHEGDEDVAYFVIARTVPGVNGGLPFWIIERQATRLWYDNGAVDADQVWSLDSAVRTAGTDLTTITGLHHMIGATALVYADGALQASKVVGSGGTITIERAANNVLVGFGYAPQLDTLRLDLGEGSSVQGKRKKVTRCTMILDESRGVTVAPMKDDINGDSAPGVYYPLKERTTAQNFNEALPFISGVRTMTLAPGWQVDGALSVKGTPGLPFTVLAVVPSIALGDDNG